jgi:hypothetical protein
MCAYLSAATVVVAASLICSFVSQAQGALPLPGCEATPEVRRIIDEKLDSALLDKMKFAERMAYQRQVLEDLIARFPREFAPVFSYSGLMNQYAPEEYATVREHWAQMEKDHPDDPLALLLAGRALIGRDTPEAIRLLEVARTKAPDFPWPALNLAGIYASGKMADPSKTKQNVEVFFALCPSSTDGYAQFLLNKDQPLQPKASEALRTRLQTETNPKQSTSDEALWGLEFRTRPPKDHDAVRAQVALDLKRLEALNPHGDAPWEAFLVTGYKQSGASKETVNAVEDRLIRDFPHSSQACDIVSDRWEKAHPKPEDETDTAGWVKYHKEYEEALRGWIRDYPDSSYLQRYAWFFYTIQNDDAVSEKDGIATMDAFLQAVRGFDGPTWYGNYYPDAAEFLIEKKWQPERALDLLHEAKAVIEKDRATDTANDNLIDEDIKSRRQGQIREDQYIDGLILRAAIEAGRSENALKLRAAIEAPVPEEQKLQSGYWLNRARFEAIQKHTLDALAYYQLAL